MRKIFACLGTLLGLHAAPVLAQGEPIELQTRYERYHVSYTVNPDATYVQTYDMALKVLAQRAVESAKQTYVGYSTSVEKADILEAYTRKPDGRRVDAPKSNYQMGIQKGRDADSPAFSDRTTLSIIFPDVEVNDTLVLKYTITGNAPMFAGHFDVNQRFSRLAAYDDVKVRVDAPASMWTQHAVTEMKEAVNETANGRKVLEWTWANPKPVKSKRRDFSAYDIDKEVGVTVSTFRNYGEIAEAYGKVARPKAVVSERVKKLADEITAGKAGQREQARALYEWVATNINYAGNCVGVGAVVPRDQSFVLDNRMGDCKDQATLLQALLAAKGIASTQALVNSGSSYRLPRIPVISMVNHVIVYVPGMDVYLDPTSGTTPFGMLPSGDSDKPVLWIDGYKDGVRTPPIKGESNRFHARTEVTVKPDGSIAGTLDVTAKGSYAVQGRDRLRDVSAQDRDEMLKQMYRRNNKTGFARLETDDVKPMIDTFAYKLQFETEEFTQMPGPGAFTISPLYMTEAPIQMIGSMVEDETEAEETSCVGGSIVEEYVYHLPKNTKILAVPRNTTVQNGLATYRSTYARKGNTITVKRELVDRTARNVCPVSVQREFAAFSRKVAADLKSQIVYQ